MRLTAIPWIGKYTTCKLNIDLKSLSYLSTEKVQQMDAAESGDYWLISRGEMIRRPRPAASSQPFLALARLK